MDATGPVSFLRSLLPAGRRTSPSDEEEVAARERFELRRSVTRCSACGLCDLAFDAYSETSHPEFRGPMAFVLGFARQNDVSGLGRQVRELQKGDLTYLSSICPARIPFPEIAALLAEEAGTDLDKRQTSRPKKRHDPG